MSHELTAEQRDAVRLFATGASLAIEAGAGTGKTSTLIAIAESTSKRGQYVAFNKSIVEDAKAKMPANVNASTAHSLAFRSTGVRYKHRLPTVRMRGDEIARRLRIDPLTIQVDGAARRLSPGYLAGLVIKATRNFSHSADRVISIDHVPYIDGIDAPLEGRRGWSNNREVRRALAPALVAAWDDLANPHGSLPFTHDCYLKLWELNHPVIPVDFILFDEAQDADPVMLSIVSQQQCQVVFVGDSCQPAGTMVQVVITAGSGQQATVIEERPIEQIQAGDVVVAYDVARSYLHLRGKKVLGVSERPYRGDLVVVKAAGRVTRYTPDHRVIVRLRGAFDNQHLVYMMRRGSQYRIGRCQAHYGRGFGPVLRAQAEGADALWILSMWSSADGAALAEAFTAHEFGIPTWTFEPTLTHLVDVRTFWEMVGDNSNRAAKALAEDGRDIRFPLWDPSNGNLMLRRALVTRACNIMDGMSVLTPDEAAKRGGEGERHWSRIENAGSYRSPFFAGTVYSMRVEDDHTYVADGIVTHNCQQIYDWRGAVNALASVDGNRTFLTNSFRFGQPIADVANVILARIPGAELRLTGRAPYESAVGPHDDPKAYLSRTNAGAIDFALREVGRGRRVHLMGGGSDIASFCRAALDLQATPPRRTEHPELACFATWTEVRDYADLDPNGDELRLMVKIIDEYGAQTIIDLVNSTAKEEDADIVVSTAHKAKGREWDVVRLGSDFSTPKDGGEPSPSELRLLYVAATRARRHLDDSICGALAFVLGDAAPAPEDGVEIEAEFETLAPERVTDSDPICQTCKAPLARESQPGEECPICGARAS